MDKHWRHLVQRVTMVSAILDLLRDEGIITNEGYSNVSSMTTTQKMMRELYPHLSPVKAKDVFYKGLEEHEKPLLSEL